MAGNLGFRDIYDLSQALLANQDWNLLNRAHCKSYRIRKYKYFKYSNVLSHAKGTQLSYSANHYSLVQALCQKNTVLVGYCTDTKIT